jgi:hypothetical protein
MWCTHNWGELLQPAPLSIALLGSIMVLSASTEDFCSLSFQDRNIQPWLTIASTALINTDDPHPYEWKYTDAPGSFKACLMQMVCISPFFPSNVSVMNIGPGQRGVHGLWHCTSIHDPYPKCIVSAPRRNQELGRHYHSG